jgi:hypothetical protein
MKRQIGNIAFGVAIVFSALAVPGYSETIIGFDVASINAGGVVTVNGSNVVTGITNVLYNEMTVEVLGSPGGPTDYTDLSATLNLAGNVLELTGDEPTLSVSSPPDLLDITLAAPLTGTVALNVLDVAFPSTTSVTVSPALLIALGITGPVTSTLFNSGLVGSGADGSYDITSETLGIEITSAAAPEPGTLPLLGIGLLGIALFLRKRLFQLQ